MKAWLASGQRQAYADSLMELKIFDGEEKCCSKCDMSSCKYRCEECFGGIRYSQECIVKYHARLPLHWIEVRGSILCYARLTIAPGMERLIFREALAQLSGTRSLPQSSGRELFRPSSSRTRYNGHRYFGHSLGVGYLLRLPTHDTSSSKTRPADLRWFLSCNMEGSQYRGDHTFAEDVSCKRML
jgi:hypothetical protein